MLDLGERSGKFDAVICVLGIFFVPDMEAAVREPGIPAIRAAKVNAVIAVRAD